MKKQYLILLLILALFLVTRLNKATEIPSSLYWDETSILYNAYAVSLDGKDEWGDFLPIHFRAFGEFKLPVFIYSALPFVKIFGLSELAVRLPAILYSLGVIVFTYLLSRKMFNKELMALLTAFILSISPWFFIFSRTGYEATAGLFFFLAGIYFAIVASGRKPFFVIATFSFILSIYSYNSFRIVVPITSVVLVIYLIKQYNNNLKAMVIPGLICCFIFFLSLVPIARLFLLDNGAARLTNIGSATPIGFVQNYRSHFSPDFLFISGDKNQRSQQNDFGQLYILELPLILIGLFFLFKQKSNYDLLIISVILISFIPPAITKESPHGLRSISVIPFLSMLGALGVNFLIEKIKYKKIFLVGTVVIFLTLFVNYYYSFLTKFEMQSSEDWQYQYKVLFSDFADKFDDYDQVMITDKYSQPYIFGLFYLKYDPRKFREEVKYNSPDRWGISTVSEFSNFHFRNSDLQNLDIQKNSLVFLSPNEKKPPELIKIRSINFLDGREALIVYEKK